MPLSDETKDRYNAVLGIAKTVFSVGWIPFIIYVGYKNSTPQPSLIKLVKINVSCQTQADLSLRLITPLA
ncbi:hypothetical protein I350_01981 [Cryptococcus amylolentus CBS 6273]|uniref:Mitochondrial import receptor subunit TOM7 n=1 Tax=Cryptococcus amylolentus CBS 6273 TaxID=1296118 RepID=A0A1E3K998_9TREE|nr:hypothetical protein I350_01981 [Cryptococcus amylolentus CBS 6273]